MSAAAEMTSAPGITYDVRLPPDEHYPNDKGHMYVTINERKGKPFEVFFRYDLPGPFEWVFATSILVSRLLQAGVDLEAIGKELQEVYSPVTRHVVPGTSQMCNSIVARVGMTLEAHAKYIAGRGI